MIIGVPREIEPGERRVALVPDAIKALADVGLEVRVEAGAGTEAGFDDAAYEAVGATVVADAAALWGEADVVLKVQPPRERTDGGHEVDLLRQGAVLIGFLKPLDLPDLARRLAAHKATSFAIELMPRITRAQSMDALSAMSTIAGYRAVLLAAVALPRIFPMLVTAAGTLSPARVLVIGAGVAGLQAIATARRLGAVVEAYDTRPAVKEQVESLGGRFVELDLDTGDAEDAGGYAQGADRGFLPAPARAARQAGVGLRRGHHDGAGSRAACAASHRRGGGRGDAAGLGDRRPGRREGRQLLGHGSRIETVVLHGVTILGPTNLPSEIPAELEPDVHQEPRHVPEAPRKRGRAGPRSRRRNHVSGALLTHEGKITNEAARARAEGEQRRQG